MKALYPFPMIFPVFGHRSEAVFSSPVSPSREPTLGVEPGSKIPPHLGPKIPAKSSEMGISQKIILASLIFVLYVITYQPIQAALEQTQTQAQLQTIQTYLNGIGTLQANFTQDNPDGKTSSGKMYLKRLGRESFGKLRLEYDPPTNTKIIADGETLRYEDGQTKETNDYPIDSTPASFLLRHKIDFSSDLKVQKMETRGEKIYLTVVRSDSEGVTLTLVFVTNPILRLQEWIVVDASANQTHVTLSQVEIGVPLDEKLFVF